MQKKRFLEWIQAVKKLRAELTAEQAEATPDFFPAWAVDKDYKVDDRISYQGKAYKVIQAHHSQAGWTPDTAVSLFAVIHSEDIEDWTQPESTNPYNKGDKVRHNGKIWESTIDGNVWEPGVYGWTEVTA